MRCVRSGNAASEASSRPISRASGSWRNTGRPKVASVTNRSQRTSSKGAAVGSGAALVVAGDDGAPARVLDHHLRAAEDVARGRQPHRRAADAERLAVAQLLEAARRIGAEPRLHDGDGLRRRQHGAVAGPRMIGMAVGDDGARRPPASGRRESRPARSSRPAASGFSQCSKRMVDGIGSGMEARGTSEVPQPPIWGERDRVSAALRPHRRPRCGSPARRSRYHACAGTARPPRAATAR